MQKMIIAASMVKELERANLIYAVSFASPHEGYAIIREELDELWDEIKKKQPDQSRLREEALQVGAMAIKFIISFERWSEPESQNSIAACDDCGAGVRLGDDYFIERGTHGLLKDEQSRMVCRVCYESKYAGKE